VSNERFACALIPYFPMALHIKREPGLSAHPLGIAETDSDAALIAALNDRAIDGGAEIGMTVAQAHTLCPDLTIKTRDRDGEKEETKRLIKILQTLSPLVEQNECDACAAFIIQSAGLRYIYKNEAIFARKIIDAVNGRSYPVTIGIAGSKQTARVAAEVSHGNNFSIVPDGEEKAFLENLTVKHLPLTDDVSKTLDNLGLRSIGQCAAFPANEMTTRFGAEGTLLAKLARGDDSGFFLPQVPGQLISNRRYLTCPINNSAMLLKIFENLLNEMFDKFRANALTCDRVLLKLHFENRRRKTYKIAVKQPTQSVATFARRLNLQLEKEKLLNGVTDIEVIIKETASAGIEQIEISNAPARGGKSANDETQRFLNNRRLRAVKLADDILPERAFSLLSLTNRKNGGNNAVNDASARYSSRNISGLRLMQPPRPVSIALDRRQPRALIIGSRRLTIRDKLGPWRLSGGWWSGSFDRLYYEIRAAGNRLYLLFYDRLSSGWFLQGIYD
jgi:nucleotidyltransferase/DNA polymerase involved in DNA repair